MNSTPDPLPPAPLTGWTEPVLVRSPDGREAVSGLAWPQDGLHPSEGLWFRSHSEPLWGWPVLEDEAVLIFPRHPEVVMAARVSEVQLQNYPWILGLSVLGQLPA